jgi:hypothetical protein
MAINAKKQRAETSGITLFELDENQDFMPNDEFYQEFNIDENNDIMPPILASEVQDEEFELDENQDIMPKE